MAKLTPREIAEKQVRKAQASTEDYSRGVNSVTDSPTAKAAGKKDKLKANFLRAVDSGKWEEGLLATSLEDWKRATTGKGAERYGSGVAAAMDKTVAFHEEFQPFLTGVKETIDRMPDSTPEQRIQKMVENAKAISKFKRTRRRR